MISRVADHCFWLGRYVERAESTARVLAVTHNLALDGDLTPSQCWQPVLIVAGEEDAYAARHGAPADGEEVMRFLTWDEGVAVSLRSSILWARENARSIREVISLEVWQEVNELHLWLASPESMRQYADNRFGFYRAVLQRTQLVLGLVRSTMLHDEAMDFLWLGVMLERLAQTARFLDVHHHVLTSQRRRHEVQDTALWISLLRACSGYEPFVKRSQGRVTSAAVARFLVHERQFPRSVSYCAHAALAGFRAMRDDPALPGAGVLAGLEALVALLDAPLDDASLHTLLTQVVDATADVCTTLGRELLGAA